MPNTKPNIKPIDWNSVVIHVLLPTRKALCGFQQGKPHTWHEGHAWVARENSHLATCPECLKRLNQDRELA